MYNLYFKVSQEDDKANTDVIYVRSMNTMTAIVKGGKMIHISYNPKKFISAEDYFKDAEYIGKFARRTQPISYGQWEDVSYMEKNPCQCNFVLIFATNSLGIGYDLEMESYEIISKEYIEGYRNGLWELGKDCTTIYKSPIYILKNMLEMNQGKDKEIDYNIKKLNYMMNHVK